MQQSTKNKNGLDKSILLIPPPKTKKPQHQNQPQWKQKVGFEGEEEGSENDGCCHHCHSQKQCMYFTLPPTQKKQPQHQNQPQRKQKVSIKGEEKAQTLLESPAKNRSCHCSQKIMQQSTNTKT